MSTNNSGSNAGIKNSKLPNQIPDSKIVAPTNNTKTIKSIITNNTNTKLSNNNTSFQTAKEEAGV